MELTPLDWISYGDEVCMIANNGTVVRFNDYKAYYNDDTWQLSYGRGMNPDRTNKLIMLFKAANINPYNTLTVTGTQEDEFLVASVSDIRQEKNNNFNTSFTKMFFDIEVETDTKNFPTPNDSHAKICIITLIFSTNNVTKGYLLSTKPSEAWVIQDLGIEFWFEPCKDEKELLEKFYQVWNTYNPTDVYHLNGYDFDIPFIIERTRKHKIKVEALGFLDYNTYTRKIKFFSRGMPKMNTTWLMPGVRNIDLLSYFRRFYPELPRHNLDYISTKFLGAGKSGLEIEEMFQILGHGTPEEMNKVIRYACIDVIRLYELEQELDILNTLITTANSMRVTVEQLLMFPDYKLIKSGIYHLNHAVLTERLEIQNLDSVIQPGVYHHLKLYDYRKDLLLNEYENIFRYSPSGIAEKLINSNFGTTDMKLRFIDATIKFTAVYWYGGFTHLTLDLPIISYDEVRFVIDQVNYSTYNSGTYSHNMSKKLKFKLMQDYLEEYYNYRRNLQNVFLEPTIFEEDIPKLLLTSKIKPSYSYCNTDNLCYQIARKLELAGENITSWQTARYYKTPTGFSFTSGNLDVEWYKKEMLRLGTTVRKIPQR